MRVLFWGTPDFAIPSLRALGEEGHAVVGVVTRPDRLAGRGRQPRPPPVKLIAEGDGIPVLQPERPRGEDFLRAISELDPEVSVVAAYGALLPENVLEAPALGSINIHASLLPELRGAAPVNWAIIRGHAQTGITIMRMVRELDAGPILYQLVLDLDPGTTAGELSELLAELGARALIEALALLEAGELESQPQDDARATYAPKLDRDSVRLDWLLPAEELARWIRGCDPSPAAWSELNGQPVQLFRPEVVVGCAEAAPGTVVDADPRRGLRVAAGEGAVRVGEVKPAGRGRMSAAAWLRGHTLEPDSRFV